MRNKKAEINWETIKLIVLIVGFIVVFVIIIILVSALQSSAIDGLCTIGSSARHSLKVLGIKILPELCTTQIESIDPSDLSSCPYFNSRLEENYIKVNRETQTYIHSICAQEQMLIYARRCWEMRGSGIKNPGNFECFQITIKEPSSGKVRVSTVENDDYKNDFDGLARRLKDRRPNGEYKRFSRVIDSIDTNKFWALHWGELVGTDWVEDKCMEEEETWAVYFEDKARLVLEEKDEIWIGCIANCEDPEFIGFDIQQVCNIGGDYDSLKSWWDANIKTRQSVDDYKDDVSCTAEGYFWCDNFQECWSDVEDDLDEVKFECYNENKCKADSTRFWCVSEQACYDKSDLSTDQRILCYNNPDLCKDKGHYWCINDERCRPSTISDDEKRRCVSSKEQCIEEGMFWCDYNEVWKEFNPSIANPCILVEVPICYITQQDCEANDYFWCSGREICIDSKYSTGDEYTCVQCMCYNEDECATNDKCTLAPAKNILLGLGIGVSILDAPEDKDFCVYDAIFDNEGNFDMDYDFENDEYCVRFF